MTTTTFIALVAAILLALYCSVRWMLPRSAPGWLGRFICEHFHGSPMQPIHSRYICRVCHRETPVEWEKEIA